jgi:hypothetical protein
MLSFPFKALCIDDRDRPVDVPTSKWVKKGNYYTVISMEKMNMQSGQIGFELEELDLSDCFPYTRFAAWRFAIPTDQFSEEKVKREEPETIDIL